LGCGDHTAWTSRPTDTLSTYPAVRSLRSLLPGYLQICPSRGNLSRYVGGNRHMDSVGCPSGNVIGDCVRVPETIVLRRLAPAIQKMFVFQTKMGGMVTGLGTKRSEMKRMDEGQAYT
jgi:hypothetical protein